MKKFDSKQTGNITCAINQLSLEKYIENFYIHSDFAEVWFDSFKIRITVPMYESLQFTLFDIDNLKIIKSVVTDTANEALPIKRLVVSLLGVLMLESFEKEWDGYTIQENNDY